MARNVYYNPRSPLILGQDPGDILGKAFGVAFTSFVNDKLVAPIALRFIPINGGEMLSKLVDAGTTVLSAWVGGQAIGIIDRSVGKDVEFGGLILAGGKVLAIPIPGFSIGASFPNLIGGINVPFLGTGTNGNGASPATEVDQVTAAVAAPIPYANRSLSGL